MKKGKENRETERHRLSGAVFFCIPVHVSPDTAPVIYTFQVGGLCQPKYRNCLAVDNIKKRF